MCDRNRLLLGLRNSSPNNAPRSSLRAFHWVLFVFFEDMKIRVQWNFPWILSTLAIRSLALGLADPRWAWEEQRISGQQCLSWRDLSNSPERVYAHHRLRVLLFSTARTASSRCPFSSPASFHPPKHEPSKYDTCGILNHPPSPKLAEGLRLKYVPHGHQLLSLLWVRNTSC